MSISAQCLPMLASAMEHRIGTQHLDITGDTALITLDGEFRSDDIRPLLALIDGINDGAGKFYILANVERLQVVQPEARRIAGAWRGIGRAGGTAIVGANLLTRTLILLVSRASTLLSNTNKKGAVTFFKTEAEARTWLDSQRAAATP